MKKIIALLMALATICTLVACGKKKEEGPTTTTTTQAVMDEQELEDAKNDFFADPETEEPVTQVVEVTNADGEAVTNEDGEAVTETVTEKPNPNTTTKKQEIDPSTWSQDKVLEFYRIATAEVVNVKPGYTKTRSAVLGGYDAGPVLEAFKGEVFKFLGIGDENKFEAVVTKGTNTTDDSCGDYLRQSSLAAADVTSAKAVKSGNIITVTIDVKDGESQTEGGNNAKNASPIDKSGICAGDTDRSGFDHKTALITYDALDDIAPSLTMYEKSTNGKIVAKIDATTFQIQELVISWDASADISKVYGSSATLSATTTVKYTAFGW
ncbi:MAG: hypothetical protein E7536_07900 [Ruminococcaceae bacterium]|nr:hypothetical protein [Oscillospiraceae bacterium]